MRGEARGAQAIARRVSRGTKGPRGKRKELRGKWAQDAAIPVVKDGREVCRLVRERFGGKVQLNFSRGKDSCAAWLRLREYFDQVVPVHFYPCPGLEWVEENLRYYEKFFGTPIIRHPSPRIHVNVNELMYQVPGNCAVIEAAGLPEFDYDHIGEWVRTTHGIPIVMPAAHGVRATETPQRRMSYEKHGLWREQTFLPIGDLKKAEVMEMIHTAGIKLPVDYELFGKSFDGYDYKYLAPLKERFPRDYQRILDFFPLAEADFFRWEQMGFKP